MVAPIMTPKPRPPQTPTNVPTPKAWTASMPSSRRLTPTPVVATVKPTRAPTMALRFTFGVRRAAAPAGGAPPGASLAGGAGVAAVSTIETSPFLLADTRQNPVWHGAPAPATGAASVPAVRAASGRVVGVDAAGRHGWVGVRVDDGGVVGARTGALAEIVAWAEPVDVVGVDIPIGDVAGGAR